VNLSARPAWYRYGGACALVGVVHCLRLALIEAGALRPDTPFVVLYFLPVIIAGWVLGFGPGLLAGALGVVIGDTVSFDPASSAPIGARVVRVAVFIGECTLISWLLWARRHGETRRDEVERRYRVMARNFPDGAVVLFDRDLRYLLADGAGLAAIGLSRAGMEGRTLGEVFPAEVRERIEPLYRAALAGEESIIEMEFRGRTWRIHAVPVRDEKGAVECGLAMTQDVTERQQLRQAQKMEAIGRLAGGVAHDFNNLLAVILGRCERLQARMQDPAQIQEIVAVRQAGERAAALTRQLLAFSRQRLLEPRSLDLSTVIADLEQMLARLITERIQLIVRVERPLPSVLADRTQIEQVLMNLCINARDAITDRGQIIIETTSLWLDPSACRQRPGLKPGRHVQLEVRDTGVGMDEAVQARLFEPFFTTKAPGKGTGLGLSIVFGIVSRAGGHIGCSSMPGSGTAFTILLPTQSVPRPAADPPSGAARTLPDSTGETVLLVEDEHTVREMLRDFLTASGYHLLIAEHGDEALAIAARHSGEIHVLVSDMVMPGMSGAELNRRLRATRPGVRTVLLSGYTEDESVASDRLGPDTVFLQKPFPLARLDERIRGLLVMPENRTEPRSLSGIASEDGDADRMADPRRRNRPR